MPIAKHTDKKGEDGKTPNRGDTVTVHCTGYVAENNVQFWSTKDKGQTPFSFKVGVGQVIKGWDESVISMELGERSTITCPPDYAYGESGYAAWGIPPNAELKFEIELLKISK